MTEDLVAACLGSLSTGALAALAWLDTVKGWIHDLFGWVESLADTPHGAWALFGISFVESSFFPIPPDVLLIALCLGRPDRALFFAAICTLASVLGGLLGYGIGAWGGRPVLNRFFAEERVDRVAEFFDRYNAWAIGIAGLTPIPYKIFTIAGGALRINLKVFVVASTLSRGLRFFVVAGLIAWIGEPAKAFVEKYFDVLTLALIGSLILGYGMYRMLRFAGLRRAAVAGTPEAPEGDPR